MPTKILRKLPPLEGVAPGEKATLDLPIGPTYHKILLVGTVDPASGAIAKLSDIMGLIKVLVNGKAQRTATAVEIDALNTLQGAEYAVQVENLDDPGDALANGEKARFTLPILLGEPFRKSYAAAEAMAWPTRWPNGATLGTFQIEVDIPATSGATAHNIVAYAVIDNKLGQLDAQGNPVFNISKWLRQTITYTASGERYIVNLPRRDLYQQLNFFTQSTDPISHIRIKRDGEEIIDVPKTVNDLDLIEFGLNASGLSDDRLDVVFDRDDLPDSALPMNGVREFEVVPTLAAAGATNKVITLITQLYGPRD
jgi:hypothetical protein